MRSKRYGALVRDATLGAARLNGHARQRAESLGMSSVCHAEQCEASTLECLAITELSEIQLLITFLSPQRRVHLLQVYLHISHCFQQIS
jgi:hypothetical protein